MEFILTLLGCLLFLEGIPYFLAPAGLRRLLLQIAALPERAMRLIGFGLMAAGLLIVFAVTRLGG